jgi:hypothetical protein
MYRYIADRIQVRAVRSMGDLPKEFDGRGGHMKNEGALISQKQATDAAGISEHQRLKPSAWPMSPLLNSKPPPSVKTRIESHRETELPVATVTALARWGRRF